MLTEFSQLNLRPELLQAVNELGYEKPTPIQAANTSLSRSLSSRTMISKWSI
jgi:superfamily II DNA/RNA helicase